MANLTQYSEHKRAEALAVVAACGGNVAEAARRVGVPRRTLQRSKDEADNRDLQAAARQGVANAKAAKVAKRIAEAEAAKLAPGDGCEWPLLAMELPDKNFFRSLILWRRRPPHQGPAAAHNEARFICSLGREQILIFEARAC